MIKSNYAKLFSNLSLNVRVPLKISWRQILNQESISWYTLSQIDFEKLLSRGAGYAQEVINDITNPFWKDILKSWYQFCISVEVNSVKDVLDSPVWYNKNLAKGHKFCIKNWYEKGVRYVSDLLDEHGNIHLFEDFKTRYGIRGTFLDYQSLLRKIPKCWRDLLNENKQFSILNSFNDKCNMYVKETLKEKRV